MPNTIDLEEQLIQIARYRGLKCQLNQTQEELGELSQAISKYNRATHLDWDKDCGVNEARDKIIEEIADVEIMLRQVAWLLNIEDAVEQQIFAKTDRQFNKIYGDFESLRSEQMTVADYEEGESNDKTN